MKATVLFISIMALCLLVIPMIAINDAAEPAKQSEAQIHSPAAVKAPAALRDNVSAEEPAEDNELDEEAYADDYDFDEQADDAYIPVSDEEPVLSFKIFDQSTGKVNEVSLKDFVRGAIAAEMPVSFHTEALKAQGVAAHTFALHNHLVQQQSPDPALKGADFAADPENMKVYITEDIAKEFYGGDNTANLYWNKICEAADSVAEYVLEYDDEPIVAAYHAISSGMTESASNIWSGDAPYLTAVPSDGDLLAPGFESSVKLSSGEVKSALESAYPGIKLDGNAANWFGEAERSSSGYVTQIAVGDQSLHGKDIRQVFGLRSHDFEVNLSDGNFIFTVTGYGHGVGLSQYGADFLARQGAAFDEILSAYYTGATLKTIAMG